MDGSVGHRGIELVDDHAVLPLLPVVAAAHGEQRAADQPSGRRAGKGAVLRVLVVVAIALFVWSLLRSGRSL